MLSFLYNWRNVIATGGAIAVGAIVLNPWVVVPAGERGVVMHFGKVQPKVLDEGLHFALPFSTSVKTLSVRVQKTDIEVPAGTKDLQVITTALSLNWHIDPSRVNTIYQEIGDEEAIANQIIIPAMTEVLKAATPKRNAEEIITKRNELKAEIDVAIEERLSSYGILVVDASLVNIAFSPEFTKSIEAKQIAEQEAKQAEYEALKASQQAEAEVNRAKGKAEAQRLLQTSLTAELIQQEAIAKWDGQFPHVMTGDGALPFVNIDAAQ